MSASGLAKKDTMSQSDPFLRVLKLRQGTEDDWVPVCKTEVGRLAAWPRAGRMLRLDRDCSAAPQAWP